MVKGKWGKDVNMMWSMAASRFRWRVIFSTGLEALHELRCLI